MIFTRQPFFSFILIYKKCVRIEFFIAGKAHLREALVLHDESQRLQRMCRDLKGKQALAKVLKKAQETTLDSYNRFGSEDDFRELLDPPDIIGTTFRQRALLET